MTAPTIFLDSLNGFEVVASFKISKNFRYVLVDRGDAFEDRGRYVTALHQRGDLEWSAGHYYDDGRDAHADFVRRSLGDAKVA